MSQLENMVMKTVDREEIVSSSIFEFRVVNPTFWTGISSWEIVAVSDLNLKADVDRMPTNDVEIFTRESVMEMVKV